MELFTESFRMFFRSMLLEKSGWVLQNRGKICLKVF